MSREINTSKNEKCPMCFENKLILSQYKNKYPLIGEMIIFSSKCLNCGYKSSQSFQVDGTYPKVHKLKIKSQKDLNAKILKCENSTIRFDNIDIEFESFDNNGDFVTNIEGVIRKFLDKANFLLKSLNYKKDIKKLNKIIEKLELVISGKFETTIILEDESGKSFIKKN